MANVMTPYELKYMNDYIADRCEDGKCGTCAIEMICEKVGGNFMGYPEELQKAYNILHGIENHHDVIEHPAHYCREGGMESIDEMVAVFGVEAVRSFCICNVWKYRYRASSKNGDEDLKKSDWYMRKYIELGKGERK